MTDTVKAWVDEHRAIQDMARPFTEDDPDDRERSSVWGKSTDIERIELNIKASNDGLLHFPTTLSMIEAVLELHEPINGFVGDPSHWECNVCADDRGPKPYPCPTVRALEGVIDGE